MINNNIQGGVAGSENVGVTWFYQSCPPPDQNGGGLTPSTSLNTLNNNKANISNTSGSSSNGDSIDLIDIEDEDHSFAAFFIGMKTGPSPYVKRPLVGWIW